MQSFIEVSVVKEFNRMVMDRDDREKTFDYAPPRATLIPISSIEQIQETDDETILILTPLVAYHVTDDLSTIKLMLVINTFKTGEQHHAKLQPRN